MRNLTLTEIEHILAKHPKAKRIAVGNFLLTVGNNINAHAANINMGDDARAYGWNSHTIAAIKEGIRLTS